MGGRDGRVQLRTAASAGRVRTTPATAAAGSHAVPYVGQQHGKRTIVAHREDLDQWQRLPYGTRAWGSVYHGGRGTIESVNSQLRDRKGLSHGECRAFGLDANTMRALGLVVCHNLKKAAEEADSSSDSGESPQVPQSHPERPQEPGSPPRAPP